MTAEELKQTIIYERKVYSEYMFPTRKRRFMAWLKNEPVYRIMKWQRLSRLTDFYHESFSESIINKIAYLWFISRRNRIAESLGIEIGTENIGPGLLLYHHGATVINGGSVIGRDCRLHGNNCIGNAGGKHRECPRIGDNVMIGVGAKIIGNVTIADNIKIAAGAVVVTSFLEPGITIGGVPARKIK